MVGWYFSSRNVMSLEEMVFLSGFEGLMNNEAITGIYVKHKIMAPMSAKQNTKAMGLNIFPSTLTSDKIGINTMMMMSWPKTADFIILVAP